MLTAHIKHIKTGYQYRSYVLLILITIVLNGCVEPFEAGTQNFSDILVIDANITNEVEHHLISLTHTFKFEDEEALPESNATVIMKGASEEYTFEETTPGIYRSTLAFAPKHNEDYQLLITTTDGTSYASKEASIASSSDLDIYAEKFLNENGEEGLGIFLDSNVPNENFASYRYDYEETHKIRSRRASNKKLVIISKEPPLVELVDKVENDIVCYKTTLSNNIITASTDNKEGSRITKFLTRFIKKEDPILRNRYSIKVNQRVQSTAAREFYKKLKDISSFDSQFSETQPGFIGGNINAINNPDKKVLGLFEISNLTSKRIFIDFLDFFETSDIPPLNVEACKSVLASNSRTMIEHLTDGYVYFETQPTPTLTYAFVPAECNDCRLQGTNIKPDFWQD